MSRPVGLAILASGRGSNARSLLQACADGRLHARAVLILSNSENAGVHDVANEFGVPSATVKRDDFPDGQSFANELIARLRIADADLICLAGYMKKIPPTLVSEYSGAILNIHPALLPKHGGKGMYGLRVHQAVLADGDAETGVTVHYVDAEYDRGPILLQRGGVEVLPADTPESLAARVLELEHQTYVEAVALWIDTRR